MWKTIKHTIRDAYFYILGRVAPKRYADLLFFRTFKRHINWEDPQDIDEKINWLKFNGDTSMWPLLADKYRVREYVAERGLAHLLVPIYGHWDKVEDIDWESLPNQFVMKTNNGSGDALICKDKSTLDIEHWKRHFAKQLKFKFGYAHAEPHYNKIKPCIIVEELLDATKQPIQSSSIADYKVWSFNGKPAYIWVCYNRTHHSTDVGVYDTNWTFHPEYSISTPHYQLSNILIPKPEKLSEMLQAAAILSEGWPEVRVDFYVVDGKLYFGEMTMTAASGINYFYTPEFNLMLGKLCELH
ncbi:MAG: glycosyltransferase [Bacteroidaceae bacterium]|nr:glycosyltransferase [Bacteroidaceae bacterium]